MDEAAEDITGKRKISSLSLLSKYDTNQYNQNSTELVRQSSTIRSSSNRICCSKIYCSPEWRRISRKSIIISVFLFFGGLVSIFHLSFDFI